VATNVKTCHGDGSFLRSWFNSFLLRVVPGTLTRFTANRMIVFNTRGDGGNGIGNVNFGSILILAGFPLLLSGQYLLGLLTIFFALALAVSQGVTEADKLKIRFDALSAENILDELNKLSETNVVDEAGKGNTLRKTPMNDEETRIKQYVEGLSALGRKYSKSSDKHKFSLSYQQFAFTTMRLYPENDDIIAGSVSLLALVAKDPQVRKRFKYKPDEFGLNRPITVLRNLLDRAKKEDDEKKEETLAEIVRKGCLFLGAVCNEGQDIGLSSVVVSEGGVELILDAANWFRFHEDVANWALWALFTLSYDQLAVKVHLLRLQGIQSICGLMKNNPTSLEVNRHGTALLFDLLRENQTTSTNGLTWDPWEVRKIALASGLHDRLLSTMNEFSDSNDIMMMGQEMLIGTGYRGDIPKYEQSQY